MSARDTRAPSRESLHELRRENDALRQRLEEADATLRALRAGEVDAVFVESDREQVFTLETPDAPYRTLVEQMSQAAATLTADGAIIHANRRFADLVSRPVGSLVGMPMHDLARPDSREALETLLHDGCSADAYAEVTLRREDGTDVTVYLGGRPMREGAYGSCIVVTDLTTQRHYEELRRTQEELRGSEERLREADRRKDEFLAVLAHELRNPLVPMRNAVELLKAKGPLPEELEWSRGVIDRQVRLMARLLDDLLDVARIVRNTLELRYERVALGTVLEAALETSRPLIDAGRHELVVSVPPEPMHLRADPARLSQVFGNILNNAAKYTDPGGRIEVVARREGAQVVVSIKDSGIGIAPDVLPKVFDIFTQSQQAIERAQGGLGVGLSLVKRLTEMHGGTVEARSEGEGRGSEFVVRLPLDAAASTASR
jgi:PAS domain S-box-containing protein